mmetsp:Transcript_24781/g.81027  ORF Transcript_24781/g.81027 Transcript_24781/m.81027 type:complete len:248 (+) Transcript_24781:426-1169(+)
MRAVGVARGGDDGPRAVRGALLRGAHGAVYGGVRGALLGARAARDAARCRDGAAAGTHCIGGGELRQRPGGDGAPQVRLADRRGFWRAGVREGFAGEFQQLHGETEYGLALQHRSASRPPSSDWPRRHPRGGARRAGASLRAVPARRFDAHARAQRPRDWRRPHRRSSPPRSAHALRRRCADAGAAAHEPRDYGHLREGARVAVRELARRHRFCAAHLAPSAPPSPSRLGARRVVRTARKRGRLQQR